MSSHTMSGYVSCQSRVRYRLRTSRGVDEGLTLSHEVITHAGGAGNFLLVEREDVSQSDVVDVDGHGGFGGRVWVGFAGQEGEDYRVGAVEELFCAVGDEAAADHVAWMGQS
jgi:hypothetical protein